MCTVKGISDRRVLHCTQGFSTNEDGHKCGFNTMVYSEPEVGLNLQIHKALQSVSQAAALLRMNGL